MAMNRSSRQLENLFEHLLDLHRRVLEAFVDLPESEFSSVESLLGELVSELGVAVGLACDAL
jgi:hypothetical protein